MTPEGRVKEAIKKILKDHGIYYCMPLGTAMGRRGVPDFVCCYEGNFVGIEAKAGRGRCTKLQLLEHEKIRKAGGVVLVINETGLAAMEHFLSLYGLHGLHLLEKSYEAG